MRYTSEHEQYVESLNNRFNLQGLEIHSKLRRRARISLWRMESLATLDFSLGNYIVNCTGENCSDVKFLNLTDSEVQEYIVQKLGHKRKDLFSSFSLTCIYVVIFITGVVGNLSTCFVIRRNRYMHTTINLYLFSLAVADLLIIVLGKYCVFIIFFNKINVCSPFCSTPLYLRPRPPRECCL